MNAAAVSVTEPFVPNPLIFDTIVSKIKPAEESFAIVLITGDVLRFRHIIGRDSFTQIKNAANRFADAITEKNAPAPLRPYVSTDRATMVWCHMMGATNLDGGGELGFLKIQHFGPVVFDDLLRQFTKALAHVEEQVEVAAVEEAKKGFRSRSSGETGSRSRKKSGAGTPESSKVSHTMIR